MEQQRKTHLMKMDRVINKALRICSGAMTSTPTKAIQVELGEVPLDLRRDKLILTYWCRLRGCGNENPTNSVIKECWEQCWGKLLLKVMRYNIALLPKKVTNYDT